MTRSNPFVNSPPPVAHRPRVPGRWVRGEITSTSPLLVLLDGYQETPQPPTEEPLVAGLVVGDSVKCLLDGGQLTIFGRYGG